MPPIETVDLHQKAVYWSVTGTLDRFGQPQVSSPLEINVRWEWGKTNPNDPQSEGLAFDATAVVDRQIALSSILWLGALDDLPGTSLTPESDIMKVVDYRETPDLKGRNYRRVVRLQRMTDTLPTVAS